MGADDTWQFGQAASRHITRRIVMVTPSTRHELHTPGAAAFTGYLVKPLRVASIAARLKSSPDSQTAHSTIKRQIGCETVEQSDTPAAAPLHSLSILVAEDNEINALLIRSLLTRLGHDVTVAANGEEALESWAMAQAANTPYDLVMMDIQMPGLDGIETTRKIREREAGRHAPPTAILALTANTLIDDRRACLESGMDGFLVKPLDQDKLADSLARLIAARHLAAWPESNAVEPDSVLD
jgi:CheY-like chemotaxis protein